MGQREKVAAILLLRFFIYGFPPPPVSFAILRHIVVAIADCLVDVQPMIERSHDGNLPFGRSICLGNKVSKNGRPEFPFLD
jgi:hypothetical protein